MERQSALHERHLKSHASMTIFAGWQMPASYAEPSTESSHVHTTAGISDASYLTKLDVRTSFPMAHPAKLWQLTPSHGLITSPQALDYEPSPFLTDVTSVYSAILLAGPGSREILQKLTTLNVREAAMPDGAARQTRLAHVNAMILRFDHFDHAGLPGFLILNTRDVAEHVWDTLSHVGARPFGLVAQQQWMGMTHDDA